MPFPFLQVILFLGLSIQQCIAAPAFVPLVPRISVAAIQDFTGSGNTRLFYQDAEGWISAYCTTGPFTTGATIPNCAGQLFAPSEVGSNTPVAATTIGNPEYEEMHVFFFSPDRVVSEYLWTLSTNTWHGGPNCTQCLTSAGFTAAAGSTVLYALESVTDNTLRVGFISDGAPGTLSEAVRGPSGNWVLATIPN